MQQDEWAVWYGPEVEGRLAGLRTLFIRELPAGAEDTTEGFDHVWLCKEWTETHGHALAERLAREGVLVSIELTPEMLAAVPDYVQQHCHLVLALAVPGIAGRLKATDTVRLDHARYDLYTATFGQLQHTAPARYNDDRRIF